MEECSKSTKPRRVKGEKILPEGQQLSVAEAGLEHLVSYALDFTAFYPQTCHIKYRKYCRMVHVKKPKLIPRRMSRLFFQFIPSNFVHVFCVPLRRPHLLFFFFFLPDFAPVKIFRKMWTTLAKIFSVNKKQKKNGGQTSGWACTTRVQNFRVYLSKTGGHLDFCA